GRQRSSDAIQVAIADDSAAVGFAYLMVMKQPERRSEAVLVDELDDRDQLLEPVLEGRAGEDERVGRDDLLHAARRARGPVLDALRLVEDQQVRRPGSDQVEVAMDRVVADDLVEACGREAALALRPGSSDHDHRPLREAPALALPLVLEGRGAHDEHPLEPDVTGEDLRGGDGLQGLPEPHLVRDEAPPGPGGEERPLTLVVVEAGADEPGEGGAPDASRKGATEDLPPALGLPRFSDELEHV